MREPKKWKAPIPPQKESNTPKKLARKGCHKYSSHQSGSFIHRLHIAFQLLRDLCFIHRLHVAVCLIQCCLVAGSVGITMVLLAHQFWMAPPLWSNWATPSIESIMTTNTWTNHARERGSAGASMSLSCAIISTHRLGCNQDEQRRQRHGQQTK